MEGKENKSCEIDYKETVHTLNLVTKMAELIVATNSIEKIVKTIYEIMKRNFGECTIGIGINSQKKRKLIRCFYYEFEEIIKFENISHDEKNSYLARCIKGNIEIQEERLDRENIKNSEGVIPKALYFRPLEIGGELIGVFTYQLHNRENFIKKELDLCKRLLNFITISLYNNLQNKKLLKLNEELRKYSEIDDLTGLYNRSSFYRKFSIDSKKKIEKNKKVYLYLIDLDNFKGVNDTFGHKKGDEAIKSVGTLLHSMFFGKMTGRYGGDEFLGGISMKSREKAIDLAQEIIDMINGLNIYYSKDMKKVGASIGIYEISKIEDLEKMLEDVDKNLYRAKKVKNTVIIS